MWSDADSLFSQQVHAHKWTKKQKMADIGVYMGDREKKDRPHPQMKQTPPVQKHLTLATYEPPPILTTLPPLDNCVSVVRMTGEVR